MKRTLPIIVAALLVLSPSAGAQAKLGQGFGVNIQSCVVNDNGGKTNGINVVYSNLNASAATEVDFLVKYHKQRGVFADRGSFVGYDRCGLEILAPDDQRADQITALVEAGHGDKVCLSQDHMCCLASPKFPYPVPEGFEDVFEQMLPTVYDQMYERPHTFLFTDFWPRLESRGMDRKTFDSMMEDNPRRLFGG